MIVCIIAGGSGTRLWPLSTSNYPKHLLKINGDSKSLLQNTYDRSRLTSENIYVVTEAGHAHHVKEQLPEVPESNFIIEPDRRGTASCVVAALAQISKVHDRDEPVAIISADHYVRDHVGFAQSFKIASEASSAQSRIVMIGIEPDHPAVGFGYIKKDRIFDEDGLVYEAGPFKEKPDYETALKYFKSGEYLWNCSYLIGSTNTILERMKKFAPQLATNFEKLITSNNEEEYTENYLGFENNSIDFGLLDFVDDLMVVPATFDWMDVGAYSDLHKASGADELGNYISEGNVEVIDVENCYIENFEDKPLAVIGLDNVVVINTKDGILVARKDLGQKVGEVAKRIAKRVE